MDIADRRLVVKRKLLFLTPEMLKTHYISYNNELD